MLFRVVRDIEPRYSAEKVVHHPLGQVALSVRVSLSAEDTRSLADGWCKHLLGLGLGWAAAQWSNEHHLNSLDCPFLANCVFLAYRCSLLNVSYCLSSKSSSKFNYI